MTDDDKRFQKAARRLRDAIAQAKPEQIVDVAFAGVDVALRASVRAAETGARVLKRSVERAADSLEKLGDELEAAVERLDGGDGSDDDKK